MLHLYVSNQLNLVFVSNFCNLGEHSVVSQTPTRTLSRSFVNTRKRAFGSAAVATQSISRKPSVFGAGGEREPLVWKRPPRQKGAFIFVPLAFQNGAGASII